jgi:two-component system chemotaxis sensor kinase CheA
MSINDENMEIQLGFLEEMAELLFDAEKDLLALEETPGNIDLVSRLFRNIHTIKGGAGMVGLDDLANFTHDAENLLDEVRKSKIPLTAKIATVLLQSLDCLKDFMQAAYGNPLQNTDLIAATHQAILEALGKKPAEQVAPAPKAPETPAIPAAPAPALEAPSAAPVSTADAASPSEEGTAEPVEMRSKIYLIQFLTQLDRLPSEQELASLSTELVALGELVSISHEKSIPDESERLAGAIHLWRSFQLTTTAEIETVLALFSQWDGIHEVRIEDLNFLPDAPENQAEIDAKVAGDSVAALPASSLRSEPFETPSPTPSQPVSSAGNETSLAPAGRKPTKGEEKVETQASQKLTSIRVDINKLDRLVNLVGELITIGARLDSFKSIVERRDRALADSLVGILDDSSRSLRELQDQAMTIRMVPIGGAFDPMTRLVRDYCMQSGKKAKLTIIGKETEVDKKVSEQISGPLKHLIRNSLDHGLEFPADREAAGKEPEGEIILNTYNKNGLIVIEVTDNGKGIDTDAVVRSAKAKGLVSQDREFSEREALELIFMPAVSSAEKVTEISGRGVGMDVVKRDIEELRGTVEVSTERGVGTTITVRIPMTLSIVDGLLVEIGGHNYVIPLSFVEECVELATSAAAGSNFLDIRNDLVPFMRLRELFGIEGPPPDYEKVVIVSTADRRVGLVVDRLVGDHQTVIKSLSRLHKDVQCFSGATILGDGSVVLILDVVRLIEAGQIREEHLRVA